MSKDLIGKKFVGTVVYNADPEKWARVKVSIKGLFDGYAVADLPWVAVPQPVFRGAMGGAGGLLVPRVGSKVMVVFDNGEINSGFVEGELVDKNSKRTALHENYPNTYGFVDENGTVFKVNTVTKVLTVAHQGSSVVLGASGNITVSSVGSVDVVAAGNVNITAPNINLNV